VKCGVLFEVRAEFLNDIKTNVGLIGLNVLWYIITFSRVFLMQFIAESRLRQYKRAGNITLGYLLCLYVFR
jgi:hypothetical protein